MRILGLVVAVFILLGFVWLSVYLWGLARPVMSYPYDYLPKRQVYIKAESPSELDGIAQDDVGLYLLVQEQTSQVLCGGIECSQWSARLNSDLPILLDLHVRSSSAWEALRSWLETWRQNASRVAVQVDSRSGLRYLKEELPRWAYGLDPVEKVKWQVARSLFLEAGLELNYEFLLLDKGKPQDSLLLEDWHRRKKETICYEYPTFEEWKKDYQSQKCSAFVVPASWWMQYVTGAL
jgi:hypothetical protein